MTVYSKPYNSTDSVCNSEFLIQAGRKLPILYQLQLSSRAPRSMGLLLLLSSEQKPCLLNEQHVIRCRVVFHSYLPDTFDDPTGENN